MLNHLTIIKSGWVIKFFTEVGLFDFVIRPFDCNFLHKTLSGAITFIGKNLKLFLTFSEYFLKFFEETWFREFSHC
jgi:hypothetical protein